MPTLNHSLQLQDRDLALLRGLFECRVMTTDHIATLYFEGKRAYTKKRLQKLKAAGFIGERRRNANEPSVLFLTRKAFTLLASRGELSEYPSLGKNSFEARANVSALTLRHELEIMDVRAAFHAALAKSEKFSILEFSTWPLLHQFETSHPGHGADVLVKPDGFIRIHEKEESGKGFAFDCFLEVDRSSEKQDALVAKAACYLEFYKSGDFAVRNGSTRDKFKDFPFRVLIVLKSAERRNNTAERLVQNNPPILTKHGSPRLPKRPPIRSAQSGFGQKIIAKSQTGHRLTPRSQIAILHIAASRSAKCSSNPKSKKDAFFRMTPRRRNYFNADSTNFTKSSFWNFFDLSHTIFGIGNARNSETSSRNPSYLTTN